MNVEIIDSKHIHGKNLREYTSRQNGQKRQTFDGVVTCYSILVIKKH